jgi:hypothetical protein
MAVSVFVNGVDVTTLHEFGGFSIKNSGTAGILTASCKFTDLAGTASINLEHVLRILDSGTEIFEGPIRKRNRQAVLDPGVAKKTYDVEAQDFTSLLFDDVIDGSLVRTGSRTDKAEVEFLVTTYSTKGVTGGATVVNTGTITRDIDYSGMNLYEALEEAAKWLGVDFYVDTNRAVHWFTAESSTPPFALSDTPNNTTTFGYRNLKLSDDSTDLINAVWVVGDGIAGFRTDAASIATYGRREGTLRDSNVTTQAQLDAAGDAFLDKYAYPEGPITLTCFRAGLRAGQTVQLTNALWSLSAVSYQIKEVTVTYWQSNPNQLGYNIVLNSKPVDLARMFGGTDKAVASVATGGIDAEIAAAIADLTVGGGNLVKNSSFEDGTSWVVGSNWVIGYDPTSPEEAFQGSKTARAALAAQAAGPLSTPFIPVARLDDYFVSAWRFVRSYSSGFFRMQVTEYNNVGTQVANTLVEVTAADTDWTRWVLHFGPNSEVGRIAFNAATTQIKIHFDTFASSTLTADIDGVQVERGGLLTAYAPAPYELYAGAITATEIADDAVTTPKLAANAVTAGKIAANTITSEELAAGSVTADKLQAVLILVSLMKTAESGNRVEFDGEGIRCFDAADNLLVNIPTDPDAPVYVNGQVEALSLLVTGDAAFRGTDNLLDTGAILRLGSYQAPPTEAPVLSQSWATTQFPVSGFTSVGRYSDVAGTGMYYDTAGGASGATPCYVFLVLSGSTWQVREYNASTGVLERTTNLPGTAPTTNYQSITRLGSDWYVTEHGNFVYIRVRKIARATGALVATSVSLETDRYGNSCGITNDGTSLYIVHNNNDTNHSISGAAFKRRVLNTSLAFTDVDTFSLPSTPFAKTHVRMVGCHIVSTKMYLTFVWTSGPTSTNAPVTITYAYSTLATPAVVANEDWPGPTILSSNGTATGNLIHDGTQFKQVVLLNGAITVYNYENWAWTTESPKYWVAYTWYDGNAGGTGTHETTIGPMATVTMQKRKRLSITTATLPGAGGVDEPNLRRIYVMRSATTPAAADLDLLTGTPNATITLTTWTAGGAAPPASNGFSTVAGVAEIRSASSEWWLRGDGEVKLNRPRFVSLVPYGEPISAGTFTADDASAQTIELTDVPATGVVAVQVNVLVRASTANSSNAVFVLPFTGSATTDGSVVYAGAVANFIQSASHIIATGGTNNRQIKYRRAWGAGTVTWFLRVTGYWTTED